MEKLRHGRAQGPTEIGNRSSMLQRTRVRPNNVTNSVSGRPSSRRRSVRGRVAISLGVSALVHVALLAWVSVTIPESPHAAAGFDRSGSTAERPPKRTIEVVRIQPPGALPSGGTAGSAEGGGGHGAAPAAAVPVRLPSVSVPLAGGSNAGLPAFAAAPASPLALPALALAPERPAASTPNRGILRRRPEAGAFPGLGERTGSGSGRGFGGGGVTITGIGTDCITPGRAGVGGRIGFGLPHSGPRGGVGGVGSVGGGWPRR